MSRPPRVQRRPQETRAQSRARIHRYRVVYAERWGKGPENLNECRETL